MSLPDLALRNRLLFNLVCVIVVVAGLLTAFAIPLEVYPDISLNVAVVETPWPGASASEVERLVTTPIENEIKRIAGIKQLTSLSHPGLSAITVEWQEDLSEAAYQHSMNELRASVDRVQDLPAASDRPYILELTTSEFLHVCLVAVVNRGGLSEGELRQATRRVRDALERLPGVHKADPKGMRDPELHVVVSPEKAVQYDVTLPEIAAVIARNNRNYPAGSLSPSEGIELFVRGVGDFDTERALGETIVRKNEDGNHVTLAEMGEVRQAFERARLRARLDGHPAMLLGISKEREADIGRVLDRIRQVTAALNDQLPPGIDLAVTWDTSRSVSSRLTILRSNLGIGVACVAGLLWAVFGLRNAVITLVGVPFAYLGAIALFPLLDITLNALSLVGLLLVSGMLVDDAILTVENIQRHLERGADVRRAIVRGTEEVMWPVVTAVATTVAAFLPMLTVPGMTGKFMAILPQTVILCLAASLFEALVVVPIHMLSHGWRRGTGRPRPPRRPGAGTGVVGAAFRRLAGGLRRTRDRVLAHPYAFLCACLAALYLSAGIARQLPVDLFPSQFDGLYVSVQAPSDASLDYTDAVMRDVEALVAAFGEDVDAVATLVGSAMNSDAVPVLGANYGLLYVTLAEDPRGVAHHRALERRLRARVEAYVQAHPGRIENALVMPPRDGPPVGKPVAARILAESYEEAGAVAADLKRRLRGLPGVHSVEDNLPRGPDEVRVSLDDFRASLHGLTFEDVGTNLQAANEGLLASTLRDPRSDDDVDIRVRLDHGGERAIDDVLEIPLRSASGPLIRLGDLARLEVESSFQWLPHFDGRRSVVVYADVDGVAATSLSVNRRIHEWYAAAGALPSGVELILGGEYELTQDTFSSMGGTLLVALLAIYTILTVQFRSYAQPLLIMLAIPLSFIGVALGMWSFGYPISVYVVYALVGLTGIVVNDSLVLVAFANDQRRRGADPLTAVRRATESRFRAVVLTTATTAVGLLPMAIGMSGQSQTFGPFAACLVWGVAFSSLLTLLVVPAAYLALEDLRFRGRRRQDSTRSSARSTSAPPSHDPMATAA